jgi:hypothetical protein
MALMPNRDEQRDQEWIFTVPNKDMKERPDLQLLTIGRVQVTGKWSGHLGQHFVAWAPPLRNPKTPVSVANGPRR